MLIDSLQIGLASPQEIREWAERSLPNGQKVGRVLNAKTVDYKTLKPVNHGLFCERIFGPVKDFVCGCGKKHKHVELPPFHDIINQAGGAYNRLKTDIWREDEERDHRDKDQQPILPRFCTDCGVQITKSSVRRSRLGYIQLVSPVAHVWYLKDRIGYIATLLGKKKKRINNIAYCHTFTIDYIVPPSTSNKPIRGEKSPASYPLNLEPPPLPLDAEAERVGEGVPSQKGAQVERVGERVLSQKEGAEQGERASRRTVKGPDELIGHRIRERALTSSTVQRLKRRGEWGTLSLVSRFEEGGDLSFENLDIFSPDYFTLQGKATGTKWQQAATLEAGEKDLSQPQAKQERASQMGQESRWGWYSQSHTFPWSPTLACPVEERRALVGFFTSSPHYSDKPIPWYSAVSRADQAGTFADLLNHKSDRLSCVLERILRHTGGEALRNLIRRFDLLLLESNLLFVIRQLNSMINRLLAIKFPVAREEKQLARLQKRHAKQARRLKVIRLLLTAHREADWMVISCLPVLPPEIRPIIRLDGDLVVASDLNKLYQRVLFRNKRLETLKMTDPRAVGASKRLLQESVDQLLDGGKGGSRALSAYQDRPLKSISDSLKGKKGRFRQNLLGKRVDYSGRSVIVVGPRLTLQECGLPREMAIRLFQPFLAHQLIAQKIASNILVAKRFVASSHPVVWEVLSELMSNHPILLNRAPTLHRLGVQAFQPRLIGGRAILLHPLVCTAFNADFDGDQMAVHIPLSFKSRAEAWKLMWSRNHLLSPATGQPIIAPTQDMVLGCYYMTSSAQRVQLGRGALFASSQEAVRAYSQGSLLIHTPIWIESKGLFPEGRLVERDGGPVPPLEVRVDRYGKQVEICTGYLYKFDRLGERWGDSVRTTPGRLIFNETIL